MAYSEASGLRIVDAPKGHAAANAGLQPEDKIIAIDGEPTRDLSMAQIVERLRGSPGTVVELEYLRDSERIRTRVVREPYQQRTR